MKLPLRPGGDYDVYLLHGGGKIALNLLHIQYNRDHTEPQWLHGTTTDYTGEVTVPWRAVQMIVDVSS